MKINEFLAKHKKSVLLTSVLVLAVLLVVHTVMTNSVLNAGETDDTAVTASNINPRYNEIMKKGAVILSQDATDNTQNTVSTSTPDKKLVITTTSSGVTETTAAQTTVNGTIPFATAIPPRQPADYSAQWNMGYLIAIDNPDTTYACSKVTLTDEDRDLLERLCMGEFGGGGFIGAALIAQSVKDAMCFDGYATVADVIVQCRYTGSTEIGTNDACRQAVRYIFDDNRDAVQHRLMYMYNPYMVQSAFHESQNFILSYQGVRFFDRWGY